MEGIPETKLKPEKKKFLTLTKLQALIKPLVKNGTITHWGSTPKDDGRSYQSFARQHNQTSPRNAMIPIEPDVEYAEWTDWYAFSGKEKKLMLPHGQASDMTKYLVKGGFIKREKRKKNDDGRSYQQVARENPDLGLPVKRDTYYKDEKTSWRVFSGQEKKKKLNYEQASDITKNLVKQGIITHFQEKEKNDNRKSYKQFVRENQDLCLPSSPNTYYKNDWNWYVFSGIRELLLETQNLLSKNFPYIFIEKNQKLANIARILLEEIPNQQEMIKVH